MSLADQIAKKNEQHASSESDIDELGLPIPTPETPEYWAARALLLHQPSNPHDIYQLHLRGDTLYLGHTPIKEDKATLFDLTHLRHSVQEWQRAAFYRALKAHVPKLSRDYLQIADNLFWDVANARLVDEDGLE